MTKPVTQTSIPGYTFGKSEVPHSPISLSEFEQLKQSALFTEDDVRALRMSYDVLADQTEQILDVWYGFIGSHPFLVQPFISTEDGKPIKSYLDRVRQRFGQWILDTAKAEYDQRWLDYQFEIALRHYSTRKNATDSVKASAVVPLRYLFPVVYPITATLKPFLAKKGHKAEDVEKMQQAWIKSVMLQVTLWSYPYVRDGAF